MSRPSLNGAALAQLGCEKQLVIAPGATLKQLHRSAHRKIRVAARPRVLRPAWRAPHRSSKRRVSAEAACGSVSMSRLLVGMITNIV